MKHAPLSFPLLLSLHVLPFNVSCCKGLHIREFCEIQSKEFDLLLMPNQCLILHQWAVSGAVPNFPPSLRCSPLHLPLPLPSPLIFSPHQIALGVHFPFGARSLSERSPVGRVRKRGREGVERATSNGFVQKRASELRGGRGQEEPNNGGSQCRFGAPRPTPRAIHTDQRQRRRVILSKRSLAI